MTNRGSANRLLVIDDEPEACDFVKEIAERQGYMVVTTTHAQAFREAVQRFQPTVIYVDLHMPEVDGMDLLHFLAREKVEARILVFSGKDDRVLATARHIGRTQGVDVTGTFQKPIDPDTLDGTLQALSTPESRLTAADLAEATRSPATMASARSAAVSRDSGVRRAWSVPSRVSGSMGF